MKAFVAIVAAAVVVFMAGSMIEEREVFLQPWFARSIAPAMAETEKKAAADALYLHFRIAQHLYATSGDPRFAERVPASAPLVDEMSREISYLRSHHVVEEPILQRLEITGIVPQGAGRVELTTREFWVVRAYMTQTREILSTRSFVARNRYRMAKSENRWNVAAWDPAGEAP